MFYIDINYDPKQAEEKEYEDKMKEVQKVEEFRREREQYGLFYLFISLNNIYFI